MIVDSDVSRGGLGGVGLTGCIVLPSADCGAGVIGCGRLRCG